MARGRNTGAIVATAVTAGISVLAIAVAVVLYAAITTYQKYASELLKREDYGGWDFAKDALGELVGAAQGLA